MSKDTFNKTFKTADKEQFDKNINKLLEDGDKIITSVKFVDGRVVFKGITVKKEEEKQDA